MTMRAIRKLSRGIARALFTMTLGEAFDWVQSVPAGERPRYSPPPGEPSDVPVPEVQTWKGIDGVRL
jgi:hypothetical protein